MEQYEVVTWNTKGREDSTAWEEVDSQVVEARGSYDAALRVSGNPDIRGIVRPAGPGVFFEEPRGTRVYEVLTLFTKSQPADHLDTYRREYRERRGRRGRK